MTQIRLLIAIAIPFMIRVKEIWIRYSDADIILSIYRIHEKYETVQEEMQKLAGEKRKEMEEGKEKQLEE